MTKSWKVYRFTFPDGKVYIGCTGQKIKERCQSKNYGKGMPVHEAFMRFPKDSWKLDVLSVWDTQEEGLAAEIAAIKQYDSTNPEKGYNLTKGGKGSLGTTHTEEWKRRNGEMMRGRKLSPETKARLALINRGRRMPQLTREHNGFYGKRHSPETLAIISAKSKSKVLTEESRRHISEGKRGKPKFHAVFCVEQGKRFPTLKAAAQSVGLNYSCISEAARVPHHTAGGYHWRFDEAI